MEFAVQRVSRSTPPLENAREVKLEPNLFKQQTEWVVDIETLEELIELKDRLRCSLAIGSSAFSGRKMLWIEDEPF